MTESNAPTNEEISLWEKYQKDLDVQTDVSWVGRASIKEMSLGIISSLILLMLAYFIYPGIPYLAWGDTILFAWFFFILIAFTSGYIVALVIRNRIIAIVTSPSLCILAIYLTHLCNFIPKWLGYVDDIELITGGAGYLLGIVLTLLPSILGTIVGLSHFQQD